MENKKIKKTVCRFIKKIRMRLIQLYGSEINVYLGKKRDYDG